jgi:hypothetical protein
MGADSIRKKLSIAVTMLGIARGSENVAGLQCVGMVLVQKWYGFFRDALQGTVYMGCRIRSSNPSSVYLVRMCPEPWGKPTPNHTTQCPVCIYASVCSGLTVRKIRPLIPRHGGHERAKKKRYPSPWACRTKTGKSLLRFLGKKRSSLSAGLKTHRSRPAS